MSPPVKKNRTVPLPGLITGVLLVVIFYFGKAVLMPLALAALFAFLLSPIVNALHRFRLPRALAVVLVTLCVFSLLGAIGWVIGQQFSSLATSLPNYKDNIRHRIVSFHQSGRGGVMENLQDIRTTIEKTNEEASKALPPKEGDPPALAEPAPAPAPAPPAPAPTSAEPTLAQPIPPARIPRRLPACSGSSGHRRGGAGKCRYGGGFCYFHAAAPAGVTQPGDAPRRLPPPYGRHPGAG